jgi:transposase
MNKIPIDKRQEIAILATAKDPKTKKKVYKQDQVAQMTGVSKSTVSRYSKRRIDDVSLKDRPRSGRPKALTDEDKDEIKRKIKKNPFLSCRQIIADIRLDCSPDTVSRFLSSIGLKSFKPAVKTKLNANQRRNRLQWAREYEDWDRTMWRRVLFTDETIIGLSSGPNTRRVRRKVGTRFDARNTLNHHQGFRGGKSIMFWGGIAYRTITGLHSFQGRITAQIYSDFLRDVLFPEVNELMPRGFIFMDDNAAIHRATRVQEMKEENGVQSLDWWPAFSSDLNPIENVWSILKERVRKRSPNSRTLLSIAFQEWENLEFDIINSLIDTMPERIRMLIKRKGKAIKY